MESSAPFALLVIAEDVGDYAQAGKAVGNLLVVRVLVRAASGRPVSDAGERETGVQMDGLELEGALAVCATDLLLGCRLCRVEEGVCG